MARNPNKIRADVDHGVLMLVYIDQWVREDVDHGYLLGFLMMVVSEAYDFCGSLGQIIMG